MKRNKERKLKPLYWVLLVLLIAALFAAFKVFGPNTNGFSKGEYLYIPTGANYETVKTLLKENGFIKDIISFDLLAKQAKYPSKIRAGKYHLTKGMSNYNIVRLLRSGKQTPVKIVINKLRTKHDFIQLLSSNLEADSVTIAHILNDQVYLSQFGLDTSTALCAVMPDTYEFWWNTSADNAFRKIEKYYSLFWTPERIQEAQVKHLSPQEVIIMASIIEEETNYNPEKGNIASVYLNRLNHGIKLQADPTAKYAYGDFTIRRVTSRITSVASPYNTYQNTGLPPGPICTPSKASIEAVLNAPDTKYLYFCASADFNGTHKFASNLFDHLKNAKEFQKALDVRGIH